MIVVMRASSLAHARSDLSAPSASEVFSENFEGAPLTVWELTPPMTGGPKEPYWHLVTTGTAWLKYHSPSGAMYFGSPEGQIGGECPTDCGIYSGSLTYKGDPLYVPATDTLAFLSFWSWENTEISIPDNVECYLRVTCTFDSRQVWVSGTVTTTWELMWDSRKDPTVENVWHNKTIDIRKYQDQGIRVRFTFDTVDGRNNDTSKPGGWYIDDIRLFTFTPSATIYLPIVFKNS